MKPVTDKRCIIGEGPIWNEKERMLYFTNGMGKEICRLDICTGALSVRVTVMDIGAFAFDEKNRLIVSCEKGVYILNADDTLSEIYDVERFRIHFANDMKVGPDGAIYVGTQSSKRVGVADKIDGKLYRIDWDGCVKVLADGLLLSNGMDWSLDETKFYHTDSDTQLIKEYDFDKKTGDIKYTGRQIFVEGVDGFTIDSKNRLLVACWGRGRIAVVDTESMRINAYIPVDCRIPASCCFCGEKMNVLAITTASLGVDLSIDENAGFTFLHEFDSCGRVPYLFGVKKNESENI